MNKWKILNLSEQEFLKPIIGNIVSIESFHYKIYSFPFIKPSIMGAMDWNIPQAERMFPRCNLFPTPNNIRTPKFILVVINLVYIPYY